MWGVRKADPDAELKSITPQAWQGQGLSINPLYDRATKGDGGPVIWTGLCFDREQFVAATDSQGGRNGPPAHTPEARPTQQAPLSSSRRGRRARYDGDEAKIVLLDALKQRATSTKLIKKMTGIVRRARRT